MHIVQASDQPIMLAQILIQFAPATDACGWTLDDVADVLCDQADDQTLQRWKAPSAYETGVMTFEVTHLTWARTDHRPSADPPPLFGQPDPRKA